MQSFLRISLIFILVLCTGIARATENYPEIKLDACPEIETNLTNLVDSSEPNCRSINEKHLYSLFDDHPLEEIFHLSYSKLVLILSNNSSDAVNLARFLTNDNKLLPKKKRDQFNSDMKFQYDFIVDNFLAYEDRNQSVIFVAYPRHTDDEMSAEKIIIESVRYANTIQLILTVSDSPDLENNDREHQVLRFDEIARNALNNVEKYRNSCLLVVTSAGGPEIDDSLPEDQPEIEEDHRIISGSDRSIRSNGRIRRNPRNPRNTRISQGINQEISGTINETFGISGKPKGINGEIVKVEEIAEKVSGTIKKIKGTNGKIEEMSTDHGVIKKTKRETKESNQKINDQIRKVYSDLITKFAANPDVNAPGKLLAKLIKKNNIFISEFTSSDRDQLLDQLSLMDQVDANSNDLETQKIQLIKCLYHSADGKLSSAMGSIITRIRSKLHSTESGTTSLSSVFSISDDLNSVNRTLLTFLNCVLGNFKTFFNKCSDILAQDLDSLGVNLSEMITINHNFSVLCWVDLFFYAYQSQYDTNSGTWIKVIMNFLDELNHPNTFYWELKRIFRELEAREGFLSENDKKVGIE